MVRFGLVVGGIVTLLPACAAKRTPTVAGTWSGYEMVRVEPGKFTMGGPRHLSTQVRYSPERQVELTRPFYVGVTEVPQGLWTSVMRWTGCRDGLESVPGCERGVEYPVVLVSFNEVAYFANELSERDGLTPAYEWNEAVAEVPGDNTYVRRWTVIPDAEGYRLPTEAEWEYLTTLGDERDRAGCYYGNVRDASLGRASDWDGNLHGCDDGYAGLAPVRSSRPGPLGLHGLFGNVTEMTEDVFAQLTDTPATDPFRRPGPGKYDVLVRGESYFGPQVEDQESAYLYRTGMSAGVPESDVGFRLVRSVVKE